MHKNSSHEKKSKPDEDAFYVTQAKLDELSREIDRISRRAYAAKNEVKQTTVYNAIATILEKPKRSISFGRHPVRKLITNVIQEKHDFDENLQSSLVQAVEKNLDQLIRDIPSKIEKLQGDLELATLSDLISKFQRRLDKKHSETEWHIFFKENPVIISLASSYPLILLQNEASIGGRKIDGKGEKIADFIYKNHISENALVVEIKTPDTKLLSKSHYRDGVYSVQSPITGAVNQVRDQKARLIEGLATLRENALRNDETLKLQTFSVDCLLIAGITPDTTSQKRSWELFRGGFSDLSIITYNELLKKLENIQSVFAKSK